MKCRYFFLIIFRFYLNGLYISMIRVRNENGCIDLLISNESAQQPFYVSKVSTCILL